MNRPGPASDPYEFGQGFRNRALRSLSLTTSLVCAYDGQIVEWEGAAHDFWHFGWGLSLCGMAVLN